MEEGSMMYQQYGVPEGSSEEGFDQSSMAFQQQQTMLQQQQMPLHQYQQSSIYQHYSPYLAQQQIPQPQQYATSQFGIHPQMHHEVQHYPIMIDHSSPYLGQQQNIGFVDQSMYRYPMTGMVSPTGFASPSTGMISPMPQTHPSAFGSSSGISPAQTPRLGQARRMSSGVNKKYHTTNQQEGGNVQIKSGTGGMESTTIGQGSSTTSSSLGQTGIPSFLPAKPNVVVPGGGGGKVGIDNPINQMNFQRSISLSKSSGTTSQNRRNVYGSGGSANPTSFSSSGTTSGSTFQSSAATSVVNPETANVPLLTRLPALPPRPSNEDGTLDAVEMERLYKEREDGLILRIEALGFEPESAWKVMNELKKGEKEEGKDDEKETPAPILGIRLLQRVDELQMENEELEKLLNKRIEERSDLTVRLQSELKDSQMLIKQLDQALIQAIKRAETAEAKCVSQEKALEIACAQQSSSISDEISSTPSLSNIGQKNGHGSGGGGGKGKQKVSTSAWTKKS